MNAQTVMVRDAPHHIQWLRTPNSDSSPRPVMVLVHGWGGSARYWEPIAQTLTTHFDCLLYDLRGFGRSPQSKPDPTFTYSLDDYAEDLLGLLDELDLERIWLMGHSLGASIATVFASRYPERVERLLLTCSGIFTYNPFTFKAFHWAGAQVVRLRFDWMQQVPLAEHLFMARFLYRPLPSAMSKLFLEDYLMAQGSAATATIRTAVSEQAAIEMPEHFADLQMPTLLVAGQADQIIPPRLGRAAACLNPCIDYQEIPCTGHFPMLEAPAVYQQVLAQFCDFTLPS